MLGKLRGDKRVENVGEFGIRAVIITREGISHIIFPAGEPLAVVLDAVRHESGDVLAGDLYADGGFDRRLTVLLEVCFPRPAGGGGAVSHRECAIVAVQAACQDIHPDRYDRRNVLEEIVRGTEAEVGREIKAPGMASMAEAS